MAINLRDSYSKVTWDLGSKKMKAEPWGKTDDTGRGIIVTIAQDSVIVTPTTETLRMSFVKPDGTDGYIAATLEGGKYYIENMSQVFAVPGKVNAELEFNDGTEFIKSISFTIDVYESQQSGNIVSSNDYTALQAEIGKINGFASQLAERATKIELEAMASGSPKGVYATLVALQTAYPAGNTNIYVVTADGNWYYWNGSVWTAGGIYQSTGIGDNTIVADKLTFLPLDGALGKNLLNKDTMLAGKRLINGVETVDATYSISDFIKIDATLKYVLSHTSGIAYYNSSKVYINNTTKLKGDIITPSAGAKYLKLSIISSYLPTYQFEQDSVVTAFEPYHKKLGDYIVVKYENIDTPLQKKLDALDNAKIKAIDVVSKNMVYPRNLFNPDTATIGKRLSGGILVDDANQCTSDYIIVNESTQHKTRVTSVVAFYDDKKVYKSQGTFLASDIITTPLNTKYVRFSFLLSYINISQLEEGDMLTTYEKYYPPYISNIDLAIIKSVKSLTGKIGLAFGDSITQNATYPKIISYETGANYINSGFGATRLCRHDAVNYPYAKIGMCEIADAIASGDWTIMQPYIDAIDIERGDAVYSTEYNVLKTLNFSTVDFMTIMYGTNDVNNNSLSLGELNSDDTYTVYGALNHIITSILTAYPHIKIYMLSPIFKLKMNGLTGNSDEVAGSVFLYEIAEAIGKSAKKYHIPFKDMYNESGINEFNGAYYLGVADGIHPNELGKVLVAEKIKKFLISQ